MSRVSKRRTAGTIAIATAALLLSLPVWGQAASEAPAQPAHGVASWYGEEFAGRTTANGEIFEPLLFTAAHRTLPYGTIVEVKNSRTGQTVRARVNDRGPLVAGRLIDLSYAAAREIGLIEAGSGEVDLTVVALGRGDQEPPAPYTVTLARMTAAPVTAPAQAATSATEQPAVAPAPAPQPAPAVAATLPAQEPARPLPASGEPPPVAFPLPAEVARAAPPTKQPAPQAAPVTPAPAQEPVVSNVEVVTEKAGVETRRQVTGDGRSTQNVSTATGEPVPAAAPRPTEPAAPARASAPRSRRFVVQVGAFAQETNANALVELLSGFRHKAHVAQDGTLYKVRIGPYDTREEAIRTRNDLESKGVSAIVVTE